MFRPMPQRDDAAPPPPRDERAPMTGWFDPGQLLRTGVQVVVSTTFGMNADFRLIEAVSQAEAEPFIDLSSSAAASAGDDFWFDFVADVGDGWDSTYAVAYHLSRPQLDLSFEGQSWSTRRGSLLVLGGDQ